MRILLIIAHVALSTNMSQLGRYETIRTLEKVHWERSSQAKSCENDFIDNVINYYSN
jgi:hypothetical protein